MYYYVTFWVRIGLFNKMGKLLLTRLKPSFG